MKPLYQIKDYIISKLFDFAAVTHYDPYPVDMETLLTRFQPFYDFHRETFVIVARWQNPVFRSLSRLAKKTCSWEFLQRRMDPVQRSSSETTTHEMLFPLRKPHNLTQTPSCLLPSSQPSLWFSFFFF